MKWVRPLVLAPLAVAACGDSIGPILRCVADCVEMVQVEPHVVIARPGDTLRYTAKLHIIGTVKPGVSWSGRPSEILDVDTTVRVVVRGLGTGNVVAVPLGDTRALRTTVESRDLLVLALQTRLRGRHATLRTNRRD